MPDYLIRVNENGSALGTAEKEACHQGEGILHSAFLVMIFNWKRQLLQAKRSGLKKLWPQHWDGTVAGHFQPGIEPEASLKKRINEEIGLTCNSPKYLFSFAYQAYYRDIGVEREVCRIYAADGLKVSAIAFNPIEVSECRFVGIPELAEEIRRGSQTFTPWFLLAFKKGRDHGQF